MNVRDLGAAEPLYPVSRQLPQTTAACEESMGTADPPGRTACQTAPLGILDSPCRWEGMRVALPQYVPLQERGVCVKLELVACKIHLGVALWKQIVSAF